MLGISYFTKGSGEKKKHEGKVVRYRRNGSPYVNPNELAEKAGTEALLGNVSESIDELEEEENGTSN